MVEIGDNVKIRIAIMAAVGLGLLAGPGIAYVQRLDQQAIHEAYVLGLRNDKSTGDFLASYISEVAGPQNGAHIAEIELLTPYAQIVDECRQKTGVNFTEQQATDDYKSRGDIIKVNVVIMLPAAYPKAAEAGDAPTPPPATGQEKSAMQPENFWQNFKFNLKQNGKAVPSRKISNQPIHSTATNTAPAVLTGENVWLEFDVKDVAAELTTVEVVTPEGKSIKANFDLKKLR